MSKAILCLFVLMTIFFGGYAQPGQLDPSFGNGGKVIMPHQNNNTQDEQDGMAIQPDGKIVMAGSTNNPFAYRGNDIMVFRLMPDGKIDSTFGENGSVILDYGPNPDERDAYFQDFANDVAITPDGKIVVVGESERFHNGVREVYTLVIRLNPNGSMDTGFDGDGIKVMDLGAGFEMAEAVSILSDGKMLVAGQLSKIYSEFFSQASFDMMVVKLKADGQYDETFGLNGVSIIDMGHSEEAKAMILQQDGKIILAGDIFYASPTNYDFAVVRLLANGNPDRSFSEDGLLLFSMGGQYEKLTSIAIQQDEKIVVTGDYLENMRTSLDMDLPVARINNDGTFDYGFNFGGTKLFNIHLVSESAAALFVDQRNNIVIGVVTQQAPHGEYDFGVFRLTPEGNLDTRFDGDGKAYVDIGEGDVLRSMQFQKDGKLVLGGLSEIPFSDPLFHFTVARLLYETNPPPLVAKATYIGPEILGTPCYGCQTAIIPLRVTVTSNQSDIRNARVKFVDRDNNTDITGWIPASKLVDPNDFTIATVDATWYYTLSYAQPVKKVTVGMMVDFGDSIRNQSSDNTMITLYMPQNDVVSGGGELFVSSTSKGKYKANEGSITMFGFYAQSKPGRAQPDGYMNMWYSGKDQTGNTVTYKLEINAMSGLGVNNSVLSTKKAEFLGTGKLWQETGGGPRMLVEDNVVVQTRLADGDNIQPTEDSLTVYIWSSNNILIHSSNWFMYKAVPQPLWHGQVTVHSGSSFVERSSEIITQSQETRITERQHKNAFEVTILNNPTRNAFSINVKCDESKVYSIRVADISGRIVEFRNNVPVAQTLQLGGNYQPGMYFAEIRQGKNVKTIRLVKH